MTDPTVDPIPAPSPSPEAPPPGSLEDALRLAEAMVFAAAEPVGLRALAQLLPVGIDPEGVVTALRERYAGHGVELVETAGGLMFRTAPDLAPRLRRVIQTPRRLPRAAMETLAIVAYHQPVTRAEIEQIRGATLAQQTLDSLLELGLIEPRGRKEVPGRPTLWATTAAFLAQFGLADLRDLPRREDLLVEAPSLVEPPDAPQSDSPQPDAPPEDTPAAETEVSPPAVSC